MSIARRTIDGDAAILQSLNNRVDVLDPIGEMPEIAAAAIILRIPIVGELHHRALAVAARSSSPARQGISG